VLKALLELLIDHTKPPLVISRLAGDAVISYGAQGQLPAGQTFLELIENTYIAFRRAIDLMVMNNTCDCNACRNINSLDLKFFVHHGTFGVDRLGGHDEMVGADVIVLHRMLKNRVTEKTGLRAYTLLSDAAVRALGIESFCEKMFQHEEEYEHLGKVSLWVQDMESVWRERKDSLKLDIPPDQVLYAITIDLPLPPERAWDYVTQMEFRAMLTGADIRDLRNRNAGRIGPGSVYRCYHGGNKYTNQIVLEWQPFEYYTTENQSAIPGITFLLRIELAKAGDGTKVTTTYYKSRGRAVLRSVSDRITMWYLHKLEEGIHTTLKEHIAREMEAGAITLTQQVVVAGEYIDEEARASLVEGV
jgi:hypothetical protein